MSVPCGVSSPTSAMWVARLPVPDARRARQGRPQARFLSRGRGAGAAGLRAGVRPLHPLRPPQRPAPEPGPRRPLAPRWAVTACELPPGREPVRSAMRAGHAGPLFSWPPRNFFHSSFSFGDCLCVRVAATSATFPDGHSRPRGVCVRAHARVIPGERPSCVGYEAVSRARPRGQGLWGRAARGRPAGGKGPAGGGRGGPCRPRRGSEGRRRAWGLPAARLGVEVR